MKSGALVSSPNLYPPWRLRSPCASYALGSSRLAAAMQNMQLGNHYHLSSCIVPFWLGSFSLQYSIKEAIVRREHRESLRENRVGAGKRWRSGACKHCIRYIIRKYRLLVRLVNFNSLRQTLCQALALAGAESNKHSERHVKPSYTASPLPSRSFSLARFFASRPVARLHWPRAWHRLHFCWGRASVALPRLSNSSFLLATTLCDGTNALLLNFFPTIYMHCLFICLVVFVGGRTRTTWICLKSWSVILPNAPRVANQPRNDALDVKLNGIVKGNKFSLLTTTMSETRINYPFNE